jgi:hypothetical protein
VKSAHSDVWQYRREFLQAAQRKLPGIGRYLRRYGTPWQDAEPRRQVIQKWQEHFKLNQAWAFQCAWITLAMWDRDPDLRRSLQWFAAPSSYNSAEGLPIFQFQVERDFFPGLDFDWFKQSVHGALEAELERFGKGIGAEDLAQRRRPKDLSRAFECLALRNGSDPWHRPQCGIRHGPPRGLPNHSRW